MSQSAALLSHFEYVRFCRVTYFWPLFANMITNWKYLSQRGQKETEPCPKIDAACKKLVQIRHEVPETRLQMDTQTQTRLSQLLR